jgi:hypothetical protein
MHCLNQDLQDFRIYRNSKLGYFASPKSLRVKVLVCNRLRSGSPEKVRVPQSGYRFVALTRRPCYAAQRLPVCSKNAAGSRHAAKRLSVCRKIQHMVVMPRSGYPMLLKDPEI